LEVYLLFGFVPNKRGRAYKRHQRMRIINYRRNRRMEGQRSWRNMRNYSDRYIEQPGRLAKHNTSCSCWMCKWEKKNSILKPKERQSLRIYQSYVRYKRCYDI